MRGRYIWTEDSPFELKKVKSFLSRLRSTEAGFFFLFQMHSDYVVLTALSGITLTVYGRIPSFSSLHRDKGYASFSLRELLRSLFRTQFFHPEL